MSYDKTVHIFGAGFSHEAGLPVGWQLLTELDKFMTTEYLSACKESYTKDLFSDICMDAWSNMRKDMLSNKLFANEISTTDNNLLVGDIERILNIIDTNNVNSSDGFVRPWDSHKSKWRFWLVNFIAFYFRRRCIQSLTSNFNNAYHIAWYVFNCIRPNDTIITFNYDELADQLLLRTRNIAPNNPIRLHLGDGFGFQLDEVLMRGVAATDNIIDVGDGLFKMKCKKGSNIELLHLHGAAFWTWNTDEDRIEFDTGILPGTMRFAKNETLDICRPLLAEPRIVKPLGIGILPTIWKKAENAIKTAEQINIIGYSLPKADIAASNMFQNALKNSKANILIIDPSCQSNHGIANQFDERVLYSKQTLAGFVDYAIKNRHCS